MAQIESQIKLVKTTRNHSRIRAKRNTLINLNQQSIQPQNGTHEDILEKRIEAVPQSARFQRMKNSFSGQQNNTRLQPSFMTTDSYTQDIFQFITNNQVSKVQQVQKKERKKHRMARRRNSQYQVKAPSVCEQVVKTNQQKAQEHYIHKSNNFMLEEKNQQKQTDSSLFMGSYSLNLAHHQKTKNQQEQGKIIVSQTKILFPNDDLVFFGEESSQNKHHRDQNPQQTQSQITEYSQIEQNILFANSKMKEAQRQLQSYILNINRCQTRNLFIFNPLPTQSRLVFETCVINTALNRQYSFWLVGQDSKLLLLTAKKYMSLTKDQYRIMQYQEEENNRISFAANLSTDFKRKQFVLDDQIVSESTKRKVYALFKVNPIQGQQSSITAYFQEQCKPLIVSNKTNQLLLKGILSNKANNINYISSFNLQQKTEQRAMKDYSLIKTKKTVAMKNSQDNLKLYIGKLHSKRYKLLAGSGLSPLIAFATLIVLIQT